MTVHWTEEMITSLRELHAQGVTIYGCADAIGVSYGTARAKCRELGLSARMNVRGAVTEDVSSRRR